MEDTKLRFVRRISELILINGISQEKLAEIADKDSTYVTRIENGKRNVSRSGGIWNRG